MTTTPAKKAAAKKASPKVDHNAVREAERTVGDKLEAERQERIETRDNPPPVTIAWNNVMQDVQSLSKSQKHDSPGAKFMFRGIDAVMNAAGPVLRKHRVAVIPTRVERTHRDITSAGGKAQRETTVTVQYTIVGPAGDTIVGESVGEAADSGDKGTPKAMSVALRTFLLQALCLPTDEPDPDEHAVVREQGDPPNAKAQQVADGLPDVQEAAKIGRLRTWSAERDLLNVRVTDHAGASRPLGNLLDYHEQRLAGPDTDDAVKARLAETLGATEIDQSQGAPEDGA